MPIPEMMRGAFHRLRELVPLPVRAQSGESRSFRRNRERLSHRYLRGEGLEIGALHEPLPVPDFARVHYLDRLSLEELRRQYPELAGQKLADISIIDDGETLASQSDASWDFVIANHVLEHCEDPIRAVRQWLRVLKPGGRLYLAVPDKRFTFDRPRRITSLQHLIEDFEQGPQHSREAHYLDWVRHVSRKPEAEIETYARQLARTGYSIHFHVWTAGEFRELLRYLRNARRYPFRVEAVRRNGMETIAILTRT